jgi:conjugative transfer pilus assembly protein TraH
MPVNPKTLRVFFLSLLLGAGPLSASALQKMFESFGRDTNLTDPTSFQDQAAGHYTAGGLYMNTKNKTVQPIQVSLPHMGFGGCGKIDLYFGGISFIRGDELKELGRSVLQGAPLYALQLGLKTLSPQIENTVMSSVEKALEMARSMLNSCQMSQQLIGGLWPKNTAASEQICKDMQAHDNKDSYAARKHCAAPDKVEASFEKAKEKHKDLLVGNYNLVWHALQKIPEYKDNRALAEFVMTLVGTIISRKEQGGYRIQRVHGKTESLKFLQAYLKGGKTERLTCDETTQCLRPENSVETIPKGMAELVGEMINAIQVKYLTNGALTEDETAFLNDASSLPIYKYIQVSAASSTKFLTMDAMEYMAISMMLHQFDRILEQIIDAIDFLAKVQIEDSLFVAFRDDLQKARRHIFGLYNGTHTKAKWKFDQAIKAEEQEITSRN